MGTVAHHGWSTSEDEIPQPTSIIMGKNLTSQATAGDAVVALMRGCNIDVTRQNYIDLAYCGDPPKPWGAELEAGLPVELQDWSQFGPIKLSRSTSSAGRRRRRSTSLNDTCAAVTARNSAVISTSAAISSRCAPPRFRRAIHSRLGGHENDEVASPWRLAVVVNGMIVPIKPELFPKKGTGERLPTPSAKDSDDYEHAHVKNRGRIRVLV